MKIDIIKLKFFIKIFDIYLNSKIGRNNKNGELNQNARLCKQNEGILAIKKIAKTPNNSFKPFLILSFVKKTSMSLPISYCRFDLFILFLIKQLSDFVITINKAGKKIASRRKKD